MSLPAPAVDQPFCTVSALESGRLIVSEYIFITDPTPDYKVTMPSLSFLIQHSTRPEKFLFDMGIRADTENYPPKVQTLMASPAATFEISPESDCISSLAKGGLKPDDIDFVCLSHIHCDHTGNPSAFSKSTFIAGEGSRSLIERGYPLDPESEFATETLPPQRTRYLDLEGLEGIGPFHHALDFYGDGSLYIIDSSGHLPGHINILARTSSDGAWIFLGGDSVHHHKIWTGESKMRIGIPGNPTYCLHRNLEEAEKHVSYIREVSKDPRVKVIFAHDIPWYKENRDGPAFWPGQIPSL